MLVGFICHSITLNVFIYICYDSELIAIWHGLRDAHFGQSVSNVVV